MFEAERIQVFGIVKFVFPAAEVLLMLSMLISYFVWIKYSEEILPEEEDYRAIGLRFAIYMSAKGQYTLFHLILLACPVIEVALLISILITGLAKTNLYHIVFLFLFIGFLGLPGRKLSLTRFLLFYSAFFLIAKYIYTLLDKETVTGYETLLSVLGISTTYDKSQPWFFFEYSFII